MSLYGMMRTGVSGMNAQANRLSTTGENIANSSTVGYKRADVQFSSMILPSTGGAYNPGGVETQVRYSISEQGSFSYTTSKTDLAIKGDGFFIVSGGDGTEYLTRAGSFVVQADGTLKNTAGFTLMGYEYSTTADPTIVVNGFDGLQEINLSGSAVRAEASTAGTLSVNLPSNENVGYVKSTSLVAFDSQGNTRLIEFRYEKTAANNWTVRADYAGPPAVAVVPPTVMTFDANGVLTAPAAGTLTTAAFAVNGANMSAMTINIGASTQLAKDFSVETGQINGQAASTVTGYDIDAEGIVSLKYSTGELVPRFRVALASVQSPDNLTPVAGNLYQQSNNSGVIIMGYAGTSGFGTLQSGALENSNVDIAEELTGMIESQRNYTANSKVFQTGSELLEVLVNLKR
ncbi:flagellar hook protein FlgE [Peteryoungia desertarenae]|uniref:Flagellar hook protein FlgE n=1 Tax=Peteryoungia desertarenae TaxID=1813451 RepID=A0ABX6QLE6_9HYPH|nr:flagellar hook protein FlgE [Peteryoungia desertarenae]QLF69379.1 flagellar hook protein FlgE [Peteryoungia desertarenae]